MTDSDAATDNSWYPFDHGRSIGTIGSECGHIMCDEEHPAGARITLERGGRTPFDITCGIYGCFVHTAFSSTESEATTKYEAMKARLDELISQEGEIYDELKSFSEEF